jgi:hypothetical protein
MSNVIDMGTRKQFAALSDRPISRWQVDYWNDLSDRQRDRLMRRARKVVRDELDRDDFVAELGDRGEEKYHVAHVALCQWLGDDLARMTGRDS